MTLLLFALADTKMEAWLTAEEEEAERTTMEATEAKQRKEGARPAEEARLAEEEAPRKAKEEGAMKAGTLPAGTRLEG